MRNTITLAANEAATITEKEAANSGAYNEVTLGQYAHLIVDGAEVTFSPTGWRACACCRKHEPSVTDDADLCTRCAAVQGTVSEVLP